MKTGIYKITNPKGRIYIGQSKNIDERIARYKKLQCCKHQLFLYRSFLKYGVDNHSFEIILRGDFTKKELNSFESKFVNEYNSSPTEVFWNSSINFISSSGMFTL